MTEEEEYYQQIYLQSYRTPEESNVSGYIDYGELEGTDIMTDGAQNEYARQLSARQSANFERDPEKKVEMRIKIYVGQLQEAQSRYPFPGYIFHFSELQVLLERFKRTPQRRYKHPVLFVLGYIMATSPQEIRMELVMDLARRTGQTWVRDADIIRYFHLHLAPPVAQS